MSILKTIKSQWIIHIFAILHAAVALSCRWFGVEDELLLTVLTITMLLILCYQEHLNIEFTASIIIVGNIIGFVMGNFGATLLVSFIESAYAAHAVSTLVTTEVLGWSIMGITRLFRQSRSVHTENTKASTQIKWTLLAATGIFFLRLCVVFLFNGGKYGTTSVAEMAGKVLSNSVGIIMLACINIIYIRFIGKELKGKSKWTKPLCLLIFMLLASFLVSIIVSIELPFGLNQEMKENFTMVFTVSFIAAITIYCIMYMVNYSITAKYRMQREKEKANLAQYRYLKLKRQVNPHFLFNSLNILDCLVCEEKAEQASTYIHKLAGIYRYMIKSEDEDLVTLREELEFTSQYVDLLKVRFPKGLQVMIDVPEDTKARFVLPCSIQLLVENATKHNIVSAENPLVIKIKSKDEYVSVSNNIIPKVTQVQSTGLGQKYIRRQYLDLSGKAIGIERTETEYKVTLPLL